MGADVRFLEELVAAVPGFGELHEIHIENHGEPLPHVFFGLDVTPAVVDSFLGEDPQAPDWRAVPAFLERQLGRRLPGVTEVIVTSFLYQLPYRNEPGHGVVEHFGPLLSARYRELRTWD